MASADERLAPGTAVGDFVVENALGEGAFGQVYRARHRLIGKAAAVKVLSRKYSADEAVVSRFVAEAQAVNHICHRNIIDIFSFGELEDGRRYYVMEYLDGTPLDGMIRREGVVPLEVAMPILKGLAKALDAAHAKGIVHRDLKPANVFVVRDDRDLWMPKLLDFGIAKLISEDVATQHKTQTGIPIGTPSYMSPEQCMGREVDARTDVYAYGVVAYQMVTGRLPFTGANTVEVLMKHIHDEPIPPSAHGADIAWDVPILAMLAKDPALRPSTAGSAYDGLERAAIGRGLLSSTLRSDGASTAGQVPTAVARPAPPPGLPRTVDPGSDFDPLASSGLELADRAGFGLEPTSVRPDTDDPSSRQPRSSWTFRLVAGVLGVTLGGTLGVLSFSDRGPSAPMPVVATPLPEVETETQEDPNEPVPAEVQPERVRIRIEGTEGAEVLDREGKVVGHIPLQLDVDRSDGATKWKVQAPRRVPQTLEFVPDRDRSLTVKLDPIRKKRRPAGKPGKNALEDPF